MSEIQSETPNNQEPTLETARFLLQLYTIWVVQDH